MHNRILTILLALMLVFALAVNASALDLPVEMPDLSQKGSLEFTMDVDGVPLDSGSLNMYYVATVTQVERTHYDFQLVSKLADAGAKLDTNDLYDDEQAEKLLNLSKRVLAKYRTSSITDGSASFTNLKAGLYLVWQAEADASDGYSAIHPFLISVPALQDNAYTMHVKADPKVPFEPAPNEPPPPPPPPYLPQTGQLNWPVPVMAVTGIALFILGWCLRLRRKRSNNEE